MSWFVMDILVASGEDDDNVRRRVEKRNVKEYLSERNMLWLVLSFFGGTEKRNRKKASIKSNIYRVKFIQQDLKHLHMINCIRIRLRSTLNKYYLLVWKKFKSG